jgi:hypothetical protein
VKRSEADAEYYFYTGKASELVRQLALGGFAVMWLFKADTSGGPAIPSDFRGPAAALLLSLSADFLQYAVSAPLWHWFKLKLEKEGLKPDDTQIGPKRLYIAPEILFYVKMVALAVAYVWLIVALLGNKHMFYTGAPPQTTKGEAPIGAAPAAQTAPAKLTH